ncbi:hypothetical protein CTAYLR_005637 [Chrysophaeum taylorii]|uniref:Methyltransferase type 11 domain-containing protein n=1 Tax=Chrysophaeum taylorii TaxID=2483200 RepID=A0AAD7UR21_9STRA|nr:hypothetical protein CTAYLR_005637 [Chrysophaeum taylorii]
MCFGAVSDAYFKSFRRHAPAWKALLEAVRTDESVRILDLASGPGESAKTMALAMPAAQITATDIEQAMVDKHAQYIGGLPNVESRVANAEDLSVFADGSFDAVTMCYGIMFVVDRPKTFAEIKRVLKPGGKLALTFWRESKISLLAREMLLELGRDDIQPFDSNKCGKEGMMDAELQAAGFEVVKNVDDAYDFGPYESIEDLYETAIVPFAFSLDGNPEKEELMAKAKFEFWKLAPIRYPNNTIPANKFRLTLASL